MRNRTRAPRDTAAAAATLVAVCRSIIGWVRAGYPDDAPRTGYSPLVALTGPIALTPRQTGHVLAQLHGHPTDTADIEVAITKTTDRLPTNYQVRTVVRALRSDRN